jgi:hypothetical protein
LQQESDYDIFGWSWFFKINKFLSLQQ